MAESLDNLSYEEAFARLEETMKALEAGDLPLEKSLALYEEGAALAQFCAQRLDEAELRVRQWQGSGTDLGSGAEINGDTAPFDDWDAE